jgi:UDP-glucose/GDP-mannose dehydrogenase family, central domain/UDP-glucose/GDP-mannose dehydrogenase family, NAD binding domain/UDP-glucose/GDP-mannose dehydrogenase family, UDP binding domain
MVSQIVATFSKKPVFGYLGMAYAMVAISIIWWRISTTCCRSSSPSVPLRAAGMGTRTFRTSTQLRERSPPRSMASRDRHQINRSGRTGDEVARIIHETRPSADVEVVSNPEFLREGAAIQDFKHPDRIVVGTEGDRARKLMAEIYRPLYLNKAPILFTDRRTAELIKYSANAFLATKITFINEIADLAEEVGADVQEEVARGIGLDNRIGSKFLHPGPGFGGSCFPKDTRALLKTAQDHEVPLRVVEAVIAANDVRKRAMARKVAAAFGGSLRGKTIAVLGLTFKPNTDDMREAPSIPLITALHGRSGARLRSRRHGSSESASSRCDLLRRPLHLCRWSRRPGDCHRMGTIPRSRSRRDKTANGLPGADRSKEYLLRRRHQKVWLRVCWNWKVGNYRWVTIVNTGGGGREERRKRFEPAPSLRCRK